MTTEQEDAGKPASATIAGKDHSMMIFGMSDIWMLLVVAVLVLVFVRYLTK